MEVINNHKNMDEAVIDLQDDLYYFICILLLRQLEVNFQ